MYLLYAPSLYVHERRHTIARQARPDGQDKRLRPSAQLELAYRVRSLRHRAIFGSVAIAPRSPFDRTPPRRSSRSHIHRRRWRRRLTARRRASSGSSRSLVGRASRGRRGHARHPLGAHAPRARASASPGTADGRSWERSNAAVSPPAIVAGGQTEATSGGSSDRTDNYMSRTTRTHTTWDGTTLRSNVLAVRCVHSWSIYIKRRTDDLCAAAGFVRS